VPPVNVAGIRAKPGCLSQSAIVSEHRYRRLWLRPADENGAVFILYFPLLSRILWVNIDASVGSVRGLASFFFNDTQLVG